MIVLFIFALACESLSFDNIVTFNVIADKLGFQYIHCFFFVLLLIYLISFPHLPLSYINIFTTHLGLYLVVYLFCVFLYMPLGLSSLGISLSEDNLPQSTGANIYHLESSVVILPLFMSP